MKYTEEDLLQIKRVLRRMKDVWTHNENVKKLHDYNFHEWPEEWQDVLTDIADEIYAASHLAGVALWRINYILSHRSTKNEEQIHG